MSEINLKDYQIKLDALFKRDQYDEVILHSRHILLTYPKNVNVYRYLGRALVALGRNDEAAPVFRRVLSVFPADYHANLGLSRVYRAQRNFDAAIWHLERAFEQDSNNKTLLDDLRDLYTQQRGSAPERVQLTARAVAEQQIRSGLFHRAIDTLRAALSQSPERIDLELLLAQTYWQLGQRIDAGETALNVLKRLPDSLEANRIMTELWLAERRPSDAQRYLSRIEAVGPYTAFQIAQGDFPPDDAYKLQELDYQREASRQLTSDRPDWLESLGDEDSEDYLSDTDFASADLAERGVGVSEDESEDLLGLRDQEWLQDVKEFDDDSDALTREVKAPAQLVEDAQSFFDDLDDAENSGGGDDDWLANLDEPFDATAPDVPTPARKATGLTGLLATLEGDTRREQEKQTLAPSLGSGSGLTDLLGALDDDGGDAGDDFAAVGEPDFDLDMFDDDDDEASDPLAWMQDAGINIADAQMKQTAPLRDPSERARPVSSPTPEAESLPGTDGFNDPLAWMRGTDIEIVEQAQDAAYDDPFGLEDDMPITDPGSTNPLAWMERAGVELVDDSTPTRRPSGIDATEDLHKDDLPSTDPLAWLKDSGIEFTEDTGSLSFTDDDNPALAASQAAWFAEMEESAMQNSDSSTDNLQWLADDALLDEMLQMEELSQTGSLPQSAPLQAPEPLSDDTPQDRQDFMLDDHDAQPPDWLSGADDDESPLGSASGGLEWLDDDDGDEQEDGEIADALDWMTEPETDDEDDEFVMALGDNVLTDTDDEDPSSAFSWELEEDDDDASPVVAFAESEADDDNAWSARMFGDDADENDDEGDAVDDSGVPDWLSGVGATEHEETISPATLPDWLSGVGAASLEVSSGTDEDEESDESFDFLSDVGERVDADSDMETDAEDDRVFGWDAAVAITGASDDTGDENDLFGLGLDQEDEAEEEPAFSWLTNVEHHDGDEDEETDDADEASVYSFSGVTSEDETDDEGGDEDDGLFILDDELETNVPDWLSGVTVDEARDALNVSAISPDDEDAFELDSVLNTVDAEDDVPGWLSGVGDLEDDEVIAESDSAFLLDFAMDEEQDVQLEPSMSVFNLDEDEDEEADQFNWMSATDTDEEDEGEHVGVLAFESPISPDADVISADDDDDPDTFSWLSAAGDVDAELVGAADEEEDEIGDAIIPDWLAGVGLDDTDDEDEGEVSESDEFTLTFDEDDLEEAEPDWLTNITASESESEDEQPVSVTSYSVDEEVEADLFAEYDADLTEDQDDEFSYDFDELDDVSAEEMPESVETIPADNAPDWLNEMVPGLDLDYANQDEDEPLEHEYLLDHPRAGSSREFAWLTSIVDEELAPPKSLPPAAATAPVAVARGMRKPRFVFSRQPAWLRKLLPDTGNNRATEAAVALDDKDDDLPPWLNLDDED